MSDPAATLSAGFLRSAERFPDRPALHVEGGFVSYRELRERAARIAATLTRRGPADGPPLTGVFASRTRAAFEGILGSLLRGHGYVPLNRAFPAKRTGAMLRRAGCRSVVVDRESAGRLDGVLEGAPAPLLLLFPGERDVTEWAERFPQHTVLGEADLEGPGPLEPPGVSPDAIAYLLFTSGSTGAPKGVTVAHRNVRPFLASMVDRYGITEQDRLSQMFDLTFDLSVFDMFVAWERGACVCCPTDKQVLQPGGFLRERELTVWFSVPSTGVFMKRLGALKPGRYPTLRWSLFCGEALPVDVVRAWSEAAPRSIVENLYGPTEVTIACMLYRWDADVSPAECENGVVPIGSPYPGMEAMVAGQDLRPVPPGEEGELLMSGPQVTPGYWQDPDKTAAAFVTPPGRDDVFYRTGDRVRAPAPGKPVVYLGRTDQQLQIHGHRVELGEVEHVLREESGIDSAVALGWPRTAGGASGIVAFLGGSGVDVPDLRRRMAARLPEYMVPREIRVVASLPLNANGKLDRPALLRSLENAS